MKFSSNALALFVIAITATTNAFVPRPPIPHIPVNANGKTALGYIKEGYDTGISPDFLNNKKRSSPRTSPPGEDNDDDKKDVIDAVVIEEKYTSDPQEPSTTQREPFLDDQTGSYDNVIGVDDIVEKMKREMSTKNPADIFPDLHEETTPPPSIWDSTATKIIQGGSLRTWSITAPEVDHTQVLLKNDDGNPLHAQIDVWDGPGHAPMKLAVYCANTSHQPFSCVIPTPSCNKQSIGIKNSGPLEFPIEAVVIADVESVMAQREQQQHQQQYGQHQQHQTHHYSQQHQQNNRGFYDSLDPTPYSQQRQQQQFFNPTDARLDESKPKPKSGFGLFAESLRSLGDLRRIDGSSPVDYASPNDPNRMNNEEVWEFKRNVDSVQVLIETNGLSCRARIEVTYDSNNDYSSDEIQQVVELDIEDGKQRPFFAVIDTPMRCPSAVRIVNLDPYSAFPITACVEPYTIGFDDYDDFEDDLNYNHHHRPNDMEFIDANVEEPFLEDVYYPVPDITIPATDVDYEFDEDFFFAS